MPKDAGQSVLHRAIEFGAIWTLYTSLDVPAYEVVWQHQNGEKLNELMYEDELEPFNNGPAFPVSS